jgi:hypothetical protein
MKERRPEVDLTGFKNLSGLVGLAKGLFFLNAGIWVLFSVIFLSRTANDYAWVVSVLMFANAAFMLIFGLLIERGNRWIFLAALAFLAVNILLTITDQVGFADLITLLLDLALVVLLVIERRRSVLTD